MVPIFSVHTGEMKDICIFINSRICNEGERLGAILRILIC